MVIIDVNGMCDVLVFDSDVWMWLGLFVEEGFIVVKFGDFIDSVVLLRRLMLVFEFIFGLGE